MFQNVFFFRAETYNFPVEYHRMLGVFWGYHQDSSLGPKKKKKKGKSSKYKRDGSGTDFHNKCIGVCPESRTVKT